MRVQLSGGDYSGGSLIASAQRSVNVFVENVPQAEGEPTRTTHFQTPGLRLIGTMPNGGPVRGAYYASNGDLFVVAFTTVFYVDSTFIAHGICDLTTTMGPVSLCDNTLTLVIVDGSPRSTDPSTLGGGVQIDLTTHIATTLPTADQGFLGADRVDFLATYFVFNEHNTPNFFVSGSLAVTFDPLNFAAKIGAPDYLVSVVASRGQLWLIGKQTCEVWSLSGAADFPFQVLPGVLIEHGCISVSSIAKSDGSIFFLSLDKQGRCVVLKASGYQATRISTHALETIIGEIVSVDAIGYVYQMHGHVIYVLAFPTADQTWCYDEASSQWHQWVSFDINGAEHRHRSNCYVYAYDQHVVGDYATGDLYALDPTVFTDRGIPIKRIRSFPHMVDDAKRIMYNRFVADMDVATGSGGLVSLRYSDDRGATWGNPVTQQLGALTDTFTSLQWRRLGMSRDKVFELSWSEPAPITLNGAFIDITEAAS